jgi:hypothetical protein
VEDLWTEATFQWHLQGIDTVLLVNAVREVSTENVPGIQIHDRHQVEESLLQGDQSVDGGPYLKHRLDLAVIYQTRKPLAWIASDFGTGFLLDRP